MALTLYYHPLSSYCHKVLVALYEVEASFDLQLVNLQNPAERAALQAIWPFGKFPVIRDTSQERDLAESTLIIEYVDHFFPRAQPLVPTDWSEALEVRQWDRFFDQYIHNPMQQLVANRMHGGGDPNRDRATLATAYSMVEQRMASRTWVGGPTFSMADCAAAPALFYANSIQPFPQDCPLLNAYLDRLAARPSYHRVLEEAKPYFSFFPFADGIPARFR